MPSPPPPGMPFVPPPASGVPTTVSTPPLEDPTPQITYGVAPSLPDPPNLDTLGDDVVEYFGYGCSILYRWHMGILPEPVAAAFKSMPVQMVRTHTGYCVKTITAVATTLGVRPTMPSPNTQSCNDILIDKLIGSFSPGKLPDGTQIFGVVVQYVYVLQQMPSDDDVLDMGASPFDLFGQAANTLQPSDFVKYLVGPAQPVTPPSGGAIADCGT